MKAPIMHSNIPPIFQSNSIKTKLKMNQPILLYIEAKSIQYWLVWMKSEGEREEDSIIHVVYQSVT